MEVDSIIVGQGIAGTLTALSLMNQGQKVVVIDDNNPRAASKISSGIINPITGRRFVKSWNYDEVVKDALEVYRQMEAMLDIDIINPIEIVRTLYTILDENILAARALEDPDYCNQEVTDQSLLDSINSEVSGFASLNGWKVNVALLLSKAKSYFSDHGQMIDSNFRFDSLKLKEGIAKYHDIAADHIIFCEGWKGKYNPYFQGLDFDPAKGEVLIVRIKGLTLTSIFKHKLFIVPTSEPNLYWVGSSNEWNTDDEAPSAEKREYLESTLRGFLQLPFEVIEHQSGIRPSNDRRRPVVIRHEEHKQMIFLNGLGAKGVSLSPHFVKQLIPMVS